MGSDDFIRNLIGGMGGPPPPRTQAESALRKAAEIGNRLPPLLNTLVYVQATEATITILRECERECMTAAAHLAECRRLVEEGQPLFPEKVDRRLVD